MTREVHNEEHSAELDDHMNVGSTAAENQFHASPTRRSAGGHPGTLGAVQRQPPAELKHHTASTRRVIVGIVEKVELAGRLSSTQGGKSQRTGGLSSPTPFVQRQLTNNTLRGRRVCPIIAMCRRLAVAEFIVSCRMSKSWNGMTIIDRDPGRCLISGGATLPLWVLP